MRCIDLANHYCLMKKIILVACSLALSLTGILFLYRNNGIVQDFSFLEKELSALDKNTLVIFDVDNTLLTRTDPGERGYMVQRANAKTILSLYNKNAELYRLLDKKTRDCLWSSYLNSDSLMLIDPQAPIIIKKLQEQGVKVIALTNALTGKLCYIPSLVDARIAELQQNGIDFDTPFPSFSQIDFTQYNFDGRHPVYKQGILLTSLACSKGELLKTFFKTVSWKPTRVIMFDDEEGNILSVKKALQELAIPFQGFVYAGAERHLPAFFDPQLAEFQLQYLMKYQRWLPTKEVQSLLHDSARVEKFSYNID